MEWLADPEAWIALVTLTALEIVLGIDNIVFISILTGRLPPERQPAARKIGLALAMLMRIALLFSLSLVMELTEPWFSVLENDISGRDLVLVGGGLFLLAKSTREIHHKIETPEPSDRGAPKMATFGGVLVQIALLDLVFSLDSVITAVGMVKREHIAVMVIAIVLSIVVMVLFVDAVCRFVERHPTFQMLALGFLLLIGVTLIGEGLDLNVPKGYVYFAMAFSAFVEVLNMRARKSSAPNGA